jgi:nucleotide-binding universal stress UspA family protein
MTTLLLPIDGSDYSARAVDYAITRARAARDAVQVQLLNVQPPITTPHVKMLIDRDSLDQYYRDESETALAPALKALRAANISATSHSRVGHAAEEIITLCTSLACDEIVIGTHGRGGFKGALMGSVAQKVVHLAAVPVVLIR